MRGVVKRFRAASAFRTERAGLSLRVLSPPCRATFFYAGELPFILVVLYKEVNTAFKNPLFTTDLYRV